MIVRLRRLLARRELERQRLDRNRAVADVAQPRFERVQLRELTVVKKNGQRVQFDRDKLARSINIALRKRPVEPERVERLVLYATSAVNAAECIELLEIARL